MTIRFSSFFRIKRNIEKNWTPVKQQILISIYICEVFSK
jgi:hypothetical protein